MTTCKAGGFAKWIKKYGLVKLIIFKNANSLELGLTMEVHEFSRLEKGS
tara:strand:+ start:1509 stop:1655 length:147 start_codon:yes stop_codon:yes gene_type:complete